MKYFTLQYLWIAVAVTIFSFGLLVGKGVNYQRCSPTAYEISNGYATFAGLGMIFKYPCEWTAINYSGRGGEGVVLSNLERKAFEEKGAVKLTLTVQGTALGIEKGAFDSWLAKQDFDYEYYQLNGSGSEDSEIIVEERHEGYLDKTIYIYDGYKLWEFHSQILGDESRITDLSDEIDKLMASLIIAYS